MQSKQECFGDRCQRILKYDRMKRKAEKNIGKERLSVLVGSNTIGTHQVQLANVGKSKQPRAFKGLDIERDLPVIYYNSEKAWFTLETFCNWFSSHFVPAIRT